MLTAGAGYGKTTALEEGLNESPYPVAWVSCSGTERSAGALLVRILDAISRCAPGAADALAERLAAATDRIDALAGTRELLADLSRLMIEPLVIVFDDAEHLDGADGALRILDELIRSDAASLRVAVASRAPLDLHVAKLRATGRVSEFTAFDLVFDGADCAVLLHAEAGSAPTVEQVEKLMAATEGWPLAIALTLANHDRQDRVGNGKGPGRNLRSAPELSSFLTEEVLDPLDPELRNAAIASAIVRVITPRVTRALQLPEDLASRIEHAGMLVRRGERNGEFTYHPLLREILFARLVAQLPEQEQRRLHEAVAPAIAADGDPIEAIEHWLEARNWPEAVEAIEREGPALSRTSPELLRRWLTLLPQEAHAMPTIRSLEGQLDWGAGDHPHAIEALRAAIRGFRRRPNPPAEWLARFVLADSLFSVGAFDDLDDAVDGWDEPDAAAAGVLAPATAAYVAVALATTGRFDESDRLAERARRHPDARQLGPVEALRLAYRAIPPGHLDRALAGIKDAIESLEHSDHPFSRRLYFFATLAWLLDEQGYPEEALETWMKVREHAGSGSGILVDTTRAWSAVLHSQLGCLPEAELELSMYKGQEQSWRTCIGELARSYVASLRGEASETLAHAELALSMAAEGPSAFIHRTAVELAPVLVAVGSADRAREIIADTFVLIDDAYPGPAGCFPRGRLLALRSWLRVVEGDLAGSDDDVRQLWEETGESLPHVVRREWKRLEDVVWDALERGVLVPESTIATIAAAFPEGGQLVRFLDHPVARVRRGALPAARQSGHPDAISHLVRLGKDPDPDLADAAGRAVDHLLDSLPPLRFEVLGGFSVRRGSWRADQVWGRPVDARLVRFLLIDAGRPVPEDLLFDAFWPELSTTSARSSLQVAVSRARQLLDPLGDRTSAIESTARTYRLHFDDGIAVDAEEFRAAATAALTAPVSERRDLLEWAQSLWGGDPMPEERYSDWAASYRERLLDSYTGVLAALIEVYDESGEHARAAATARDLVDLDQLNEGGHRALIIAYARAGRRGYALRQYLECRRALVEQLGVEPAEATTRLQARILAGEPV